MKYSEQRHLAAIARREAIMVFLADNPGAITTTIAAEFGETYAAIANALRYLSDKDLIHSKRDVLPGTSGLGVPRMVVRYFVGSRHPRKAPTYRTPPRDPLVAALFGPAGGATA